MLVNTCSVRFFSMLTLTYPQDFPQTGKGVKRNLNHFLTRFRQEYEGCAYLWFLEFQERGAPHIHILTEEKTVSGRDRAWLGLTWADIVCNGHDDWHKVLSVHRHPKAWERVREKDGMIKYVTKYCLKTKQKDVPEGFQDVGRWWGKHRKVYVSDPFEVGAATEKEIRQLLLETGHPVSSYEILPSIIFGVRLEGINLGR